MYTQRHTGAQSCVIVTNKPWSLCGDEWTDELPIMSIRSVTTVSTGSHLVVACGRTSLPMKAVEVFDGRQ